MAESRPKAAIGPGVALGFTEASRRHSVRRIHKRASFSFSLFFPLCLCISGKMASIMSARQVLRLGNRLSVRSYSSAVKHEGARDVKRLGVIGAGQMVSFLFMR